VAYRDIDTPTWSYTAQSSSAAVANEFSWPITGLAGQKLHYYKGVYTIDGYEYESDVGNFTTLDWPVVVLTVNETDLEYVKVNVDYYCNGADELSVYCRLYEYDEYGEFVYTDERDSLTGNGTEYFTISGLIPQTRYVVEAIGEYVGGEDSDPEIFWTTSISTYPVLSNLSAQFFAPYTLWLSMNVIQNDVDGLDVAIRFWLRSYPYVEGNEYVATPDQPISADGLHYIDVTMGEFVDWDNQYSYYGEIDYISGTNQTEVKVLSTPAMEFYVMTLQPELVGGSSVKLNGWRQLGDYYVDEDTPAPVSFLYWKTGDISTAVNTDTVDSFGMVAGFSATVTGLVYSQNYSYQAVCYAVGAHASECYGDIVTFVVGQGGTPTIPSYSSIWAFLWGSAPGHWLVMLIGMGGVALVFFRKHRTVALLLCLMILGLGIVIGWIDVWIIVLLAIGGGLYIWRKVIAGRGSSD
jgi:hypothetical protein